MLELLKAAVPPPEEKARNRALVAALCSDLSKSQKQTLLRRATRQNWGESGMAAYWVTKLDI